MFLPVTTSAISCDPQCETGKYLSGSKTCVGCYVRDALGLFYYTPNTTFGGYPNIAIGKDTYQSSTYHAVPGFPFDFSAPLAVDHQLTTFQHTNAPPQEWSINLGVNYAMTGINMVNRIDCCLVRFKNIDITIYNTKAQAVWYQGGIDSTNSTNYTVSFSPPVVGSFITVSQKPLGSTELFLHLAEFEVYGYLPLNNSEALAECRQPLPPACPNGSFCNGGLCKACQVYCQVCSSSSMCLQCVENSYQYSSGSSLICVESCPSNTTNNNQTKTCDDVDECSAHSSLCDTGYTCKNTYASYVCEDTNECIVNSSACPFEYTCVNSVGSYSCSAPSGLFCGKGKYRLNTTTTECLDVNECAYPGLSSCQPPSNICINTNPLFTCACNSSEFDCDAPCLPGKYLAANKTCVACYVREAPGPYYYRPNTTFGGYPNIAIAKDTFQSSTYHAVPSFSFNFSSYLAVDHQLATFQHTNEPPQEWNINLGVDYVIIGINLAHRTDCCLERFKNIDLVIYNTQSQVVYSILGINSTTSFNHTVVFSPPVVGSFITLVQKPLPSMELFIHLAEFEVYGFLPGNTSDAMTRCGQALSPPVLPAVCPNGTFSAYGQCLDINECLNPQMHDCVSPLVCANIFGHYECCKVGYKGIACAVKTTYILKSRQTGYFATAGAAGTSVVMAPQGFADLSHQLWSFVPDEGGFLQNIATGDVIDINGGVAYSGVSIITWPRKNGYNWNQRWSYDSLSFVVTSLSGNLVLDVKEGSIDPFATLIAYYPKPSYQNHNQRFELVEYIE